MSSGLPCTDPRHAASSGSPSTREVSASTAGSVADGTRQRGEIIERHLVGPVHVLDDQQHRRDARTPSRAAARPRRPGPAGAPRCPSPRTARRDPPAAADRARSSRNGSLVRERRVPRRSVAAAPRAGPRRPLRRQIHQADDDFADGVAPLGHAEVEHEPGMAGEACGERAAGATRRRGATCRCRRRRARTRCRRCRRPRSSRSDAASCASSGAAARRTAALPTRSAASTNSTKRHAVSGASIPLTCAPSIGAHRAMRCAAACTASSSTVSPAPASFSRRAARLTELPITVYARCRAPPRPLATTSPDAMPMCTASGWPAAPPSDGHRAMDLGRGAHRAHRVVVVRDRRAEHGHHRVADVLVDAAAEALDDLVGDLVEPPEHRVHVLRIERAATAACSRRDPRRGR